MKVALDEWDQAIRTAEAALPAETARADAPLAARMRATLAGAYVERGRTADAIRELEEASRLDPSRADLHTLQGLVHDQLLHQPEMATAAFRRATAIDPRNPVGWYVLAQQLLKTQTEESRATLRTFQRSWEQQAIGKGRTAFESPFARLTLVQEKARSEPFFPPVVYAEGFAQIQQGNYAGAIAQFRSAIAHDPLAARRVDPREAIGQGATAFRDGSLETAIRRLEVAIELEPDRAEPHRILGRAYLANDQEENAIRELTLAAQLSPGDERARLSLADALGDVGRFPQAEQAYQQIIDAFPTSGRARYALGRLYQREGRYEDALRAYAAAVTFRPLIGLNGIYQSMGALHAARQNFDAALEVERERIEVLPNDADAHFALGETYRRLNRHDEALAELAMTLMLAAGRGDAYAAMAQVHLEDGRYREAIEAARQAISLQPGLAQAHYLLGTALVRLDRTDEGQLALAEFQRLQAEEAAAHARELELGGIRREAAESSANGDHERAVSLLRRALALEPKAAVSHLNLGLALLYAGHAAEAVERLASAVSLGGPFEAHQHLAAAYAALGKGEDSRRELAAYEQLKQDSLRRAGAGR
jgi:tetratricopeptide (TPR) repeat protein